MMMRVGAIVRKDPRKLGSDLFNVFGHHEEDMAFFFALKCNQTADALLVSILFDKCAVPSGKLGDRSVATDRTLTADNFGSHFESQIPHEQILRLALQFQTQTTYAIPEGFRVTGFFLSYGVHHLNQTLNVAEAI